MGWVGGGQVEAPYLPFYLSWSATSQRVTYLTAFTGGGRAPGRTGVGLDLFRAFGSASRGESLLDGTLHVEDGGCWCCTGFRV